MLQPPQPTNIQNLQHLDQDGQLKYLFLQLMWDKKYCVGI